MSVHSPSSLINHKSAPSSTGVSDRLTQPQATAPARLAPRASLLNQSGWSPDSDLDLTQWRAIGGSLGRLGRYSQWWIGDWLLYARGKWGEMYAEAVKITGYDYGSLRNMASVAQTFDLSRRRDKLSYGHHVAIAALDPDEQDHWLDRAVALKWSREDLRVELRAAERLAAESACVSTASDDSGATTVVCPKCGDAIQIPEAVTKAIISSNSG